MAQKSSKQQAEEAVLDLKGKLRQLNKTLAGKGAVVAENATLVDTIKAVEAMKSQAVTMTIFKSQQFIGYVDAEFPPMRISDGYKSADLSYCFAQNRVLRRLPTIENIDMVVNLSSFVSGCPSLIDVSLGALPNATNLSRVFESCSALTRATIGDVPKATDASFMFSGCNKLEEVSINLSGGLLTGFAYAFFGCKSLRRVTGIIDLSVTNWANTPFWECTSLEEVRIKGLKEDFDLSACGRLSVESVRYLINNAQNVTGKRIDLSRALLDAHEEELGDLGDTVSDKGWTINYK